MLAGDLVDRILEVAGGYYTRAKCLTRVNGEQNKLLGSNCAFMSRWVELATTAGVLSYSLPLVGTEKIRSAAGVYVSTPLASNCSLVPNLRSQLEGSDGTLFRYKINGVTINPADPVTGGGTINFSSDPLGRTVFINCTVWPFQLLMESDPISIPEEYAGLLEIMTTQLLYDRGFGNSDNLNSRLKTERRAWSVFLSTFSDTKMGRPAWGFTSGTFTQVFR